MQPMRCILADPNPNVYPNPNPNPNPNSNPNPTPLQVARRRASWLVRDFFGQWESILLRQMIITKTVKRRDTRLAGAAMQTLLHYARCRRMQRLSMRAALVTPNPNPNPDPNFNPNPNPNPNPNLNPNRNR